MQLSRWTFSEPPSKRQARIVRAQPYARAYTVASYPHLLSPFTFHLIHTPHAWWPQAFHGLRLRQEQAEPPTYPSEKRRSTTYSQYFAESTRVLSRQYSSTLGAVLEYFHRSTGVFLLEYSSIPTEVLWRPSILLPLLPFPVWKAGDGFIPCTMEYFHLNAYKVITVR